MIIGITGTIGAGKGTVVGYLKEKGFRHYSSSNILCGMLREQGLPETRTYMSPLADRLAEEYPGGVLYISHERAKEEGAESYVLESIHRPSEAQYVRSLGGFIVGVDADIEKRYARTVSRRDGQKDDVTFEEFVEHARREDEGEGGGSPNIRAVLKTADIVLTNNGSPKELYQQIDSALETLSHR